MSIRFHCSRCRQLLGIATRKAGTQIDCPKCGMPQQVPSAEAAAAALAMDQAARATESTEADPDLTVYDDWPVSIETTTPPGRHEHSSAEPRPNPAASMPAAPTPAAVGPDRGGPVPSGMVVFPRQTVYIQGLLLAVLFAAGLAAGYLIGRGAAPAGPRGPAATGQRALVEGRLVYDPGTGRLAGDNGAMVILLPVGATVRDKISPQGLHPHAPPDPSDESVRTIRRLGGEYARADASGSVASVLPDRGSYFLLIVSSHAERPQGVAVDEADLVEIERYFAMPDLLIRQYKYRWTRCEIGDAMKIDWNFGRDAQGDAHQ